MDDLFVGVTTWNSELFLEQCLKSIERTTAGLRVRVGVVDNFSRDRSAEIAQDMGADVHREHCSQSIALNRLLDRSGARHTLLIHSDVVLLSSQWYSTCLRFFQDDVALISPEDIGCGPLTRPYGAGMPESCFMLFDTMKARRAREIAWVSRRRIPWPVRRLNLEHYYVTHHLPDILARRGYKWQAMRVHPSPSDESGRYQPNFTPQYWSDRLSSLRYAMGNFYSLDGVVSHYHNWFDRVPKNIPIDSVETTEGEGRGMPLAFLSLGTRRFLDDLESGQLRMPDLDAVPTVPCVIPASTPDLTQPWRGDGGALVA